MGLLAKLRRLDARAGMGPADGETWADYYARMSKRRLTGRLPLVAVIGEMSERLRALEARVAELERASPDGR